jgi:outer membrane protein assembly factor BamB
MNLKAILLGFRSGISFSGLIAGQVIAVAIMLSLLPRPVAGATDQWPMYQANASHTGFIPITLDPSKFALRWEKYYSLGSYLSGVTAVGGRAFLVSDTSVYAIDSGTGDVIWSNDLGADAILGQTSYSAGIVYVNVGFRNGDSFLKTYDAETGTLIFDRTLGSYTGDGRGICSPVIYKRMVYLNAGNSLGTYSLDLTTGNQDWFLPFSQYCKLAPAVDENWAYFYTGPNNPGLPETDTLNVIDRVTGQPIFGIPFSDVNEDLDLSPDAAPVLGGLSDLFITRNQKLIRFDLNARNVSWANTDYFLGQPAVANGTVYAVNIGGDGGPYVGAFDQTTGALKWKWVPPQYEGFSGVNNLVVTNSHLFVCTGYNTYCIDLNTHQQVWSNRAYGSLSLGGSTLYIAEPGGTLTAIGLGMPDIYVPDNVGFAYPDTGQISTQAIPITNVGDAPLELESIQYSSEEFIVQMPQLPMTIGPHQSANINVQFTPISNGTGIANLLIASNDPNEPVSTVALKGERTINASASAGGQISPSGPITVLEGDSLDFIIIPNPGYQLLYITIDGTNIVKQSTSPLIYTLEQASTDHTVTAVFAHYFDYFGVEAGNQFRSRVMNTNGATARDTEDYSLDTQSFVQPSFLDTESLGSVQIMSWTQVTADSLMLLRQQQSGSTIDFNPPIPMIKTPLAAKASWTATTTATESGISIGATYRAIVSPQTIVTVPAGTFLTWPITLYLQASTGNRSFLNSETIWFAPYIGTVKSTDSMSTTVLASFAVAEGTVSVPPPLVASVSPASAIAGDSVTVNGYQFGAKQGTGAINIGSLNCQVVSWSDERIRFVVPEAASPGPVKVVTDTWTSNDSVQLKIPPQVTGISPSSGKRGSTVGLTGTNFGTVSGKINLGSTQVVPTQWTDTSASFAVPNNMPYGTYSVTVVNSQGHGVLKKAFTVIR